MTVAFKTALGNGLSTTSNTTVTITTTAAIDIGDLVVVRWAADNLSATTPTATCADGGNTYTVLRQAAVNATAAAGVAGGILATKATVGRPSGSTITVTLSGAVAHKCVIAESFTGVENTVRSTAVGATGTATGASAGASGTVNAGDLVLGHIANETRGTITGDSDATNGAWSTQVIHRSSTGGSDATCVSVAGQYKIPTASGAQTYNVTAVAAEWVCQCVVLQATPEPSITQAAYRFYEDGTETGSVAMAAQDTAITADTTNGDGTGQLRVRLQSTAGTPLTTDDYQLQWEKNASGSWNNVQSDPQVYDQTGWAGSSAAETGSGSELETGQSFLGNGQKLAKVAFFLSRAGTPPGNVTAQLYAHSGTYGTSSIGASGTPLTTSAPIAGSAVSVAGDWNEFTFDESFTLVNGTPYVITVKAGNDGTNKVFYSYHFSGNPHPGNYVTKTGASTWNAWSGLYDMDFRVFTRLPSPPTTVVAIPSALQDDNWTTNRLTGGTGSFLNGRQCETGQIDRFGITANNFTELVFSLLIKAANVTNGDTLRFRVLRNGATTGLTYTATPTINITSTAPLGGKIKYWNGSGWVEKPVKYWNGSAWVEKPLKVWTGSAWVLS